MTQRVIQWATGAVGQAAMEGVLDHPDLELVGAWVHSPSKDGVDLGTLMGRDPLGVAGHRAMWRRCWPSRPTAWSTARSWPTPPW